MPEFLADSMAAIGKAMATKSDLVVYLADDSEESIKLKSLLDMPPAQTLLDNTAATCLHIVAGTQDAQNIQKTFPDVKTPSVSVIGTNPTGLKTCIESTEDLTIGPFMMKLVTSINKSAVPPNPAVSASTAKPVEKAEVDAGQKSAIEASSSTSAGDLSARTEAFNEKLEQKRREREAAKADEEREKERQRREDGKKLAALQKQNEEEQWAVEAAKRAATRRSDKQELLEMKQKMAQEKADRIEKNKQEREEAEARRAALNPQKEEPSGKKILVALVLPDGRQPRQTFIGSSQGDLISWAASETGLTAEQFILRSKTPAAAKDIFPNTCDASKTLESLISSTRIQFKLEPTGRAPPSQGPSTSTSTTPNQVAPNPLSQLITLITGIITWIGNMLQSIIGGGAGNAPAAPAQHSRSGPSQTERVPSRPSPSTGDAEAIRRRRTGRFHDLKRDEDSTTNNGNSTAQL